MPRVSPFRADHQSLLRRLLFHRTGNVWPGALEESDNDMRLPHSALVSTTFARIPGQPQQPPWLAKTTRDEPLAFVLEHLGDR